MHVKAIATLSLAAVLVTAPQAFAFWGGGSRHAGGSSGSVAGLTSGTVVSGGSVNTGGGTGPVSTPEPFAAAAVVLGLVGARLLRRR
jgi:MYXO-CTERM domain-containing protein